MSRLVKPIEYAKAQGITRQAVYAKIKKGALSSKTIDGKIYVVLDKELEGVDTIEKSDENDIEKITPHLIDVKELLCSKDETITVLKESISDLKQTNTEINTTLRGEIELLKQVFTEMRQLYVKQVDYMSSEKCLELENKETTSIDEVLEEVLDKEEVKEKECWITITEFFKRSNIKKEKKKKKIKKRLNKAYLNADKRVKKEDKLLYVSCYEFYEDIIK